MPFLSKDWRSSGDQWVKIGPGWERKKIINYSSVLGSDGYGDEKLEPKYNLTTRSSREIRRQNSLAEALLQLDFYSACHDIRRFNYTCHMIQLLINYMNYLPGNVQRILIRLIRELSSYSKKSGCYGNLRYVLETIREAMLERPVWGGQLGSSKLWQENRNEIEEVLETFAKDDIHLVKGPPIIEFPEEIIRQIVLKLNSEKDIDNVAQTNAKIYSVVNENRIWRQLCYYHFEASQIDQMRLQCRQLRNNNSQGINDADALKNSQERFCDENKMRSERNSYISKDTDENEESEALKGSRARLAYSLDNWKLIYEKLKRKYGLRKQDYAEELTLCRACDVLFWPTSPHDCDMDSFIQIKPGDFIKYFCI